MRRGSGFAMQVLGVPQLQRRLGSDFLVRGVRGLLTRLTLKGERWAKEGIKVDTGALARGMQSEVRGLTGRVFNPLGYARAVDEGRRPGARMPPPAALVGWIRRHAPGMSPFVLARAIGRRGIKGRFFMKAALGKLRNTLPGEIRKAQRDIQQAWRGSRR